VLRWARREPRLARGDLGGDRHRDRGFAWISVVQAAAAEANPEKNKGLVDLELNLAEAKVRPRRTNAIATQRANDVLSLSECRS